MNEQRPLAFHVAVRALIGCAARTVALLATGAIQLPREHVGLSLSFADGTSARVFRETAIKGCAAVDPCVLVVEFRLRGVRGRGHALFRRESLLNTLLFAGFPGLVSKLWLAHDQHERYRGLYEWAGPDRAEFYARCLWRVLALVSVPGSIGYVVLPGLHRDGLLDAPRRLDRAGAGGGTAWWRLVEAA